MITYICEVMFDVQKIYERINRIERQSTQKAVDGLGSKTSWQNIQLKYLKINMVMMKKERY